MSRVIIVTGIPGTGKTTICNTVHKLAESSGKQVVILNYGTVMVELSKEQGSPVHRDDMRKSELSFQRNLQLQAAKRISKLIADKTGQNFVIDTHVMVKTAGWYWAGLPVEVLKCLNPDLLVLVEAEPEEVLARRFKNPARKRDRALRDEVVDELAFSRHMAAACSVVTGAAMKIVKNPGGKKIEVAKEILKLLE